MHIAAEGKREVYQSERIPGHHQKVAVGCWFTATGKAMPQLIKYEDHEGCIQVLKDIQVLCAEPRYYAGVFRQKYECSALMDGRCRKFILLYNPENNSWEMILPVSR